MYWYNRNWGTSRFVLYREVSFIRRLKCTGKIGIGTSRFVLYREVFFIRSVLYRRLHCTPTPSAHHSCALRVNHPHTACMLT